MTLGLHGFSFGRWHRLIGSTATDGVLLGEAREVRWDDWLVQIPLALAQRAHDPPFPVVNRDIGVGANMLVPIASPVLHPIALFRPTFWGFFLGPDVGIAWLWWTQVLGLFSAWFCVLCTITRNQVGLSLMGAALLLFAPIFQFYSFNGAPAAMYAGLTWFATVRVLAASRRSALMANGLLLGWSAACFALAIYPPYQITLAYLLAALLTGFIVQRWNELPLRVEFTTRVVAFGLAIVVVVSAIALLWRDAGEVIEVLRNTEYPGRRFERGGEETFWRLSNTNFLILLQTHDLSALGRYISSAASFWVSWPLVAIGVCWRALRLREWPDPLLAALILFNVGLTLYCVIGVPDAVAKVTLLSFVPAERSVLALSISDALLLIAFLGDVRAPRIVASHEDAVIVGLWAVTLANCLLSLRGAMHASPGLWLWLSWLANVLLGFVILRRWKPVLVVSVPVVALILSTAWFNPLAQGGSREVLHGEVSEMITQLDQRAGGKSVWISYGDRQISNLFRMLGVRALDGVQAAPHFDLWKELDPDGSFRSHYNRFAHVIVGLAHARKHFYATTDTLMVEIDPTDPVLDRLGVTHLLVNTSDPHMAIRFGGFEPAARAANFIAYERPLRRRGAPHVPEGNH